MEQFYEPLQSLLNALCRQSNAHICIHDISGILNGDTLHIAFAHQVHSKPFCDAAKSMPAGFRACIFCKMQANKKAVQTRQPFEGHCIYGLYEVVRPVVLDGKTQCIIYIGNCMLDKRQTAARIRRTTARTGVPEQLLFSRLSSVQPIASAEPYRAIARLIDSYIRLLYAAAPQKLNTANDLHWAVQTMLQYIDMHYGKTITLSKLAKLYYVNEKYIGRLFKQQTGKTFHAYLNDVRLSHAASLLRTTTLRVTDIALMCGFQNVTYFNRQFRKTYQQTPVQFRIAAQQKKEPL